MRSFNKGQHKYDLIVFSLILSLVGGVYGGSLTLPRLLTIVFIPQLLSKIRLCWRFLGGFVAIFIFFYIYCLFSMLWTPDQPQGGKELIYYFVHFIMILEIIVFSSLAVDGLKAISTGWLLGILITLPIAIWELTSGHHLAVMSQYEDAALIVGGISIERPFAAVTFGGYNGYITYLCWGLPFVFYLLLCNEVSSFKKFLVAIILIVTFVVMITNASRGGALSLLIMVGIYILMRFKGGGRFVIIGLAVILVLFLFNSDLNFLIGLKSRGSDGGLMEDETRVALWEKALGVFGSSYGLGVGIGGMKKAMTAVNASVSSVHNLFLEILIQYGILFFLFFIAFLLSVLRKAAKCKQKNIKIVAFMFVFALPTISVIDSGYLLSPEVYASFASVAVFVNYERVKKILLSSTYLHI